MSKNKQYPFLVIKEDKDKRVILKFGPDSKDMNIFMNLFLAATMQFCLVISKLGNSLEEKEELFNYLNANFSTALDLGFPEVIEKIKQEEILEALVVEAVEDGEPINKETKKTIEKMKKKVETRMEQKLSGSNLEKLIKTRDKTLEEINFLNDSIDDLETKDFLSPTLNEEKRSKIFISLSEALKMFKDKREFLIRNLKEINDLLPKDIKN